MVESVVQSHAEIVVDSTEKLKIRVLHVDDELGLLKVAKQCLELQGPFHVDTAGSVEEALNKLKEKEYDAVVSDYLMPGKDGLEFLEVLRKSGNTIPFVMFTGKGREEVAVKAWSLGADHYVNRTGDPGTIYCELAHNIRQAVEKKKAVEMRNVCQQRFLCLVENAAAGVGIFDPQGRFTYVNDALANLLGYPARELAGRHFGDFLHEEDKGRILESFRQFSELETEPPTLEFRAVRKDGRLVYLMAKPTKSEIDGKIVGSQAIIVDITERKKMEQDLVDNQERLQRIFSASPDAITLSDINGNIVECNQTTLDILELSSKEELIGKSGFVFIPEKDHQRVRENLRRTLEQGSVKNVEYTFLTKSGREIPTELSSSVFKDSSGKIVGFVSVAKDITGRKKAEEVLRASEEKHRSISDITADFLFSCVKVGEEGFAIDWIAGATEKILGYSAKEIKDKGCWKFAVQPQDLPIFDEKVTGLKPGQSSVCELRITHKDGSIRWIKTSSQVVKDSINPTNLRLFGACEDITERKQVEQELRRFSVAVKTSLDGVISGDLNGNIADVNEAALRMYGGTDKSDLIGKNVIDLLVERDRTRALHDSLESMKTGQGKTVEYCALTKSGIEVPIEITTAFMKEERGEPTGFVDIIRNITERKEAELALKESEARYRSLVEQSLAGIIIAQGPAVHAVFVNKAMTDIWGYTAEEFYSSSQQQIEKMIHPEDRSLFFKSFEDRLEGKNMPSRYEFRALRKDGNVIWLEICAGLIEYNGRPAVQGIFTDITERRTAEEALHESMESHKELAESISDMFFAMDKDFRYTYWNKASEELTGISAKDAIGKSLTEVFPDVKGTRVEQFYKEALRTQQPQSYLNKYQLRGKNYVFELNAYPTKTGLSVFVKDITERKKAEQTLHASLDRYRSYIEVTGELGWTTNADGEVVEDIPSFRKFTGQTYEEVKGWGWSKVLHPDDLGCTTRIWKEATRTKSKYEVEYRLRRHDGVYRYFMARGVPVFEEGGSIREWVGTCIDITERKEMEKALLQSQQKFEQLFMSNPEAAVYVDPSERVLNVNPRFTELFGYSADEVNGRFLDDFVVPEDRKKEALMLAQKGREGYFYYETYRKNRKGSLIPVAISTAPIMFNGQHPGDMVMYKDITERKKAEEELCRAMEKLELANEKLRVVGGLTRHDVRNKLSAITGNIYLNKKRLADHPDVLESYVDMESACEQIVRIFDFAKDYEMLGVEELVYVDVEKIVNEAASFFADLRGVKVANECHGLTVLADSLLRQLFYNLIDNSLKHGERPTRIRIHCEKTDGDQLKLVYEDDGIGISLDAKPKIFDGGYTTGKGSGYGLYLIKRMMDVYGWRIDETGVPGKGAQFTIDIPKAKPDGRQNYRLS